MLGNMKKQNQNIPKLRFPEFSGDWGVKRLKDIASKVTDKNRDNLINNVFTNSASRGIVNQREYFDKDIANQNNLQNYYIVEDDDFIYNPRISNHAPVGPVSLNQIGRGVMSPLYSVFRMKCGNLKFVEKYFSTTKWHEYMKGIANYGARSDRMNITTQDFYLMPIPLPIEEEQQKIANFLTLIDNRIEKLIDKKNLLENYKKGVMQQIFSQKIRFKDYDGGDYSDWERKKFNEILFEHKLKSSGKEEVFSVSVHKGVVNQIEHLGRSFAAKETSHYNLVKNGDMIYTKSPTGDFPYGIIKQSKVDKNVIVSPLYGVFTPKTKALGYILDTYFSSRENTHNYLHSIIQKGAKNTINITNDNFLSKSMFLPQSKEERQKIANLLTTIDKKIENIQTQISESKTFKKGLLQKMFV